MKYLNFLWNILNNERGGGGGGHTTVTNTVPGASEEERAIQKQQLEITRMQVDEAKRQNEILSQFGPMIKSSMQQQLEGQQQAYKGLEAALKPTEQDLMNQQIEGELLSNQQKYLAGETPELSADQQQNLNELAGLYKQNANEAITRQFKTGMLQSKKTAMSRGVGSSSIRDVFQDKMLAQALGNAGEASRGIEQLKFNAAWQLPQAQQTFETGMSQFQQALNQQAQSNKQNLYGSLTSNQNPFATLGSFMDYQVPGTNWIDGNAGAQGKADAIARGMAIGLGEGLNDGGGPFGVGGTSQPQGLPNSYVAPIGSGGGGYSSGRSPASSTIGRSHSVSSTRV